MSFPGGYYLTSRYDSNILKFLVYLAKYWGSIVIFYEFNLTESFNNNLLFYGLTLLLYFSVYDYFCYKNDQEPDAITPRDGKSVSLGVTFFYFLLLSFLGLFIYGTVFYYPICVCIIIISIFYLHNRLSEKLRVITYFLLYFIKPFLFFNGVSGLFPLVIFSSLYAFSYIPYYFVKKFKLEWPNVILKTVFSGIVLKCFFLICFIPHYTELWYIFFWQILFTIVDHYFKNKL